MGTSSCDLDRYEQKRVFLSLVKELQKSLLVMCSYNTKRTDGHTSYSAHAYLQPHVHTASPQDFDASKIRTCHISGHTTRQGRPAKEGRRVCTYSVKVRMGHSFFGCQSFLMIIFQEFINEVDRFFADEVFVSFGDELGPRAALSASQYFTKFSVQCDPVLQQIDIEFIRAHDLRRRFSLF